jgi:hypothetical protein
MTLLITVATRVATCANAHTQVCAQSFGIGTPDTVPANDVRTSAEHPGNVAQAGVTSTVIDAVTSGCSRTDTACVPTVLM